MGGGTMTRGRCRTRGVEGSYWITSTTSSRWTTAPGVMPRSSPTVKALRSTWRGSPPLRTRSWSVFRNPRRTLTPAVSNARLSAAGLPGRVFVGDMALVRALSTKRTCSTSRQSAVPGVQRPGRVGEPLVLRGGRDLRGAPEDAHRVPSEPDGLPRHRPGLGERGDQAPGHPPRGGQADVLATLHRSRRTGFLRSEPVDGSGAGPAGCARTGRGRRHGASLVGWGTGLLTVARLLGAGPPLRRPRGPRPPGRRRTPPPRPVRRVDDGRPLPSHGTRAVASPA